MGIALAKKHGPGLKEPDCSVRTTAPQPWSRTRRKPAVRPSVLQEACSPVPIRYSHGAEWIWKTPSVRPTRPLSRHRGFPIPSAEPHHRCGPALCLPFSPHLSRNCHWECFLSLLHLGMYMGGGRRMDEGLWQKESSDHFKF